ncbi:MAG: sensor domain-containing diguanylate cyclase [Lachnospiraceae bacterium]|nr:sensor domain-containing diguanylate cyclase [Lachnospiraceae bacterium]
MKKTKRISIKIAFVIGLVEIITMAVLFFVMNQNLTGILEKTSIEDMNVIAKDRAGIVETYITDCVDFLNGYHKATEIREALENSDDPKYIQLAQDYTDRFAEGYADIEGLYVAKWDTYVLAHINPDSVNQTFRTPESAKELEDMIKKKGKAFCTGIVQAPVTKKMVIPVYAPVFDKKGKAIGFAGAAFFADRLENTLRSLAGDEHSSTGYSLINASTGVYIFDENMDLSGTECKDKNMLDAVSGLQNGVYASNTTSFTDKNNIICCYYMADRDWVFAIRDTKTNIFSVVDTVRNLLILICIILTVVMVLICVFAVDRQMAPIKTINRSIVQLKQSNFTKDPLIDKYCEREDELGNIATAVKDLQTVMESQYELFLEMLEAQSVGTLVLSADKEDIVLINHKALSLFGLDNNIRNNINIDDIRSKFDDEENQHIKEQLDVIRNTEHDVKYEAKINLDDNKMLTILAHAKGVSLSNGDKVIIFSLTDITDRKDLENALLILSETDFLTNICNRRSGVYRIEENVKNKEYGMFCLFDVDKFKYVNDTFGHAAGDALLIEIARTMKKSFRTTDILIRLGGDEFVVFATGIDSKEVGEMILKRFLDNISSMDVPELKGHRISISLGAVIINDESDFSSMYEKADSLMYDCKKKSGNSYLFYN